MRLTTALLLGLLAAVLPGAPALAVTEPDSVTWGITPATEEGPDDRVSLRLELEPGTEHRDHLAVTNFSEREVTFELTASDGVVSEGGDFGLLPGDEESTAAGTWIEVPEQVTVEAGQSAVVPVTITVPDDALPGDHPAGVAATLASGVDGGIGLDAGVGVRMHLRVAGEVVPSVELTDVSASYTTSWNPVRPGVLDLEWTVSNTGNVRLGAEQLLDVTAPFGLDPGVAEQVVATQREVLPGQAATFSASVEAWPMARLAVRLTSTQEVVGEDAIDAEPGTAVAEESVTAVPWPHLAVLVLLLLAVVALVVRRRRARARLARAVAAARAEGAREASPSEGPRGGASADESPEVSAESREFTLR